MRGATSSVWWPVSLEADLPSKHEEDNIYTRLNLSISREISYVCAVISLSASWSYLHYSKTTNIQPRCLLNAVS